MSAAVPLRETFWNIAFWAQVVLYPGGIAAMAVFAYGIWQRVQLW